MSQPKKVLFVSPVATHPPHRGNRQRTLQLANLLRANGIDIELAIGRNRPISEEARSYWPTIHRLKHSPRWRPSKKTARLDSWYTPGLGEEVAQIAENIRAEAVLLTYVFHSKLFTFLPPEVLKVLDAQDVFSNRNSIGKNKKYSGGFFSCSLSDEATYLSRADLVIAIAPDDKVHFQSIAPSPTTLIPFVGEGHELLTRTLGSGDMPIFGITMSANDLNLASLSDFVHQVDKKWGRTPPFRVLVAGNIDLLACRLFPHRCLKFRRPWLTFLGSQISLDDFYTSIHAAIVPVIGGSGMAVKFAEAVGRGIPAVSTTAGSRGHEVEHRLHRLASNEELVASLGELDQSNLDELRAAGREIQKLQVERQDTGVEELLRRMG